MYVQPNNKKFWSIMLGQNLLGDDQNARDSSCDHVSLVGIRVYRVAFGQHLFQETTEKKNVLNTPGI